MPADERSKTPIFHVDPQPIWRDGLAVALEGSEFVVTGCAAGAGEALTELRRSPTLLVLSEVELADASGFDLLERISAERLPVKMAFVTSCVSPAVKSRAYAMGAAAVIAKGLDAVELVKTLRRLQCGKTLWRKRDLSGASEAPSVERHQLSMLTPRERETLLLLTRGMTNKQIAGSLSISYETVKEHVQHILRKLHVDDRTQAAIWAVRHGLA